LVKNTKNADKIRLFYFARIQNFGDILNLDIFDKIFGIEIAKNSGKKGDIVAIGSLLQVFVVKPHKVFKFLKYRLFYPRILVWGSGFIEPAAGKNMLSRRLDVRACRGLLTLERLEKMCGAKVAENVVIADPGILASRLFDTSKIKKKYALGIIPHYLDKGDDLLKKIKVKNSVVIDIQQSPESFMKQLAQCKSVIASAMHGLIAADSLGIPNMRMIVTDKITGGDYKFDDYYSAFGIKNHNRVNLNKRGFTDKDLPGIKSGYNISKKKITELQDALIACFPYKKAGSRIVPWR